ncbi:hypothetical protein D9M70_267520 [compost metagenome]
MLGEQQRVGATEATTGAGDDYDFVFEADGITHETNSIGQEMEKPSVGQPGQRHKQRAGC